LLGIKVVGPVIALSHKGLADSARAGYKQARLRSVAGPGTEPVVDFANVLRMAFLALANRDMTVPMGMDKASAISL